MASRSAHEIDDWTLVRGGRSVEAILSILRYSITWRLQLLISKIPVLAAISIMCRIRPGSGSLNMRCLILSASVALTALDI